MHVYLPDVGRATQMHRPGDAGDPSAARASDVVGIDVESDGAVIGRTGECCATGAQRLCQDHAHTTMQQTIGLARPVVHWNPCPDEIVTDFQKLNAEAGHRSVNVGRLQRFY